MPFKKVFGFFVLTLLMINATNAVAINDTYSKYQAIDDKSSSAKLGLTAAERQELLTSATVHPVADVNVVDKYDKDGSIGFCFGRAMTVHLLARQRGLHPDSIAKLYIVGDLRSGPNPEWRFHVTTLVRGAENNRWYAIDPIMTAPISTGRPLLMEEWIRTVKSVWDRANKANLYLVNRNGVIPNMRTFPASLQDEKGEYAIELKFNPRGKAGFKPVMLSTGVGIYEIEPAVSAKHFIPANEFDFDKLEMKIVLNGNESTAIYPYQNYFVELMQNLPFRAGRGIRALGVPEPDTRANATPNLRGFRAPVR